MKLDAATLDVLDRVTVWTSATPPLSADGVQGRELSLTSDGAFGALAITGAGLVVKLRTSDMTVVAEHPVSAVHARHAAISPDGLSIAVGTTWRDGSDGTLLWIDTIAGTEATLAPPTLDAGTSAYMPFLKYGPDGRLYCGRAWNDTVPGVSIFDPATSAWVEQRGHGNAAQAAQAGGGADGEWRLAGFVSSLGLGSAISEALLPAGTAKGQTELEYVKGLYEKGMLIQSIIHV